MHPVYRQILVGVLLLISIIRLCVSCQKRNQHNAAYQMVSSQNSQMTLNSDGWGAETEAQLYKLFYSQAANLQIDAQAKSKFADCCVEQMKKLFPAGPSQITVGMSDSVKLAAMQVGVNCAQSVAKTINVWNNETLKQLKLRFYSYEEVKYLPKKAKDEYVECLAYKVKTHFPSGVNEENPKKHKSVVQDFVQQSRTECLKLITAKYSVQ
jgi:hypothetical protein